MEYNSCGDNMHSRLWEELREQGITQTELAEKLHMRQSEISRIVNDQKPNLTLRVAMRIARFLGRTVEYLWHDWLD